VRPAGRTLQKSTHDKVDRAFPSGNALFFFGCRMSLFRLRRRGFVGAKLLHLAGASPLGKKKHKALFYNKGNYLKFLRKRKSF